MLKKILLIVYILLLCSTLHGQQDSFRVKGFHLDLRIQVMKMPALMAFAKRLSEQHINTLVMEWEATYPYEKHAVISNRYAYKREEIIGFVKYCNSLGIDVIPLQQSFGHVEYILRHSRYKELREDQKDYSQVNPIREEACKALFTDLYKDLISTHTSRYIHIGGDETYLLGHSEESRQKVGKVGKGRLYGDYIKMLCELVVSMGKIPVVWADIALKYPDALKGLPAQTVFIDWNYGWDLNRFGDHQKLMQSGFEIWGSPAIRSGPDNYFLTDWEKHFKNISTFIPEARRLGYRGMIMTSWSTSGIYSSKFESATELTDLHAVRRVYPITGFDILISAFFQSLKSTAPLQTEAFIIQYCKDNWGFNEIETLRFWKALKCAPFEVTQGSVSKPGITIPALLDSATQTAAVLKSLHPSANKTSFQHFILMNDIRIFYLTCMLVEAQMNDVNYTRAQAAELLRTLNKLQPAQLNKQFAQLNNHVLYPSEIETENRLRNERWEQLKNNLEHE
jgi:hexosaminidase